MNLPTATLLAALGACLVLAAPSARAESRDATTVALGWQTENADLVVVGTVSTESPPDLSPEAAGAHQVDFRVDRVIKGPATAGSSVSIVYTSHGAGLPWRAGVPHLLFLRRAEPSPDAPDAPVTHLPLSGAFSVRPLPEGSAVLALDWREVETIAGVALGLTALGFIVWRLLPRRRG